MNANERIYYHPIHTEYGCDLEGNVYSMREGKLRVLKPQKLRHGYMLVRIYTEKGKYIQRTVHSFVFECVTGQTPSYSKNSGGLTIDHIDRDVTNNCFENLRLYPGTMNRNRRHNTTIGKSGEKYIVVKNKNSRTYYVIFIRIEGESKYFGSFTDINAAIVRRDELIKEYNIELIYKENK